MKTPPLTIALQAYRYGLYVGEPAVAGLLAWRSRKGKEDPGRLSERRGLPGRARPVGPLAWMHGASVGEVLSLVGLIDGMIARGFSVLVTTGTRSAAELIGRRLPAGAVHQYMPLDAPRWIERFIEHWQPDLALVAESEIWPNTVIALHQRGIPLLLVNGRMSERSFKGWARSPRTAEALLSRIAICLAQTKDDAERFERLGAPRVSVAGNLKYDSAVPPADEQQLAYLRDVVGDRPVWVAASTHPGEDAMVAEAHATLRTRLPNLLTIVVPRHPHRGGEVAECAAAVGLRSALRSRGGRPHGGVDLYVADTLGELGLFYRLAPLVFLGGSMTRRGGQNPIEPTRLHAAILHGPNVQNFAQVYRALDEAGGAMMVADAGELAAAVGDLLHDTPRSRAMAEAGNAALRPFEGAVERTLAILDPFIAQMKLAAMAGS
ncbi:MULTISPECIES: 3-deoxy-D-manno-octulosonic acid transferase [Methylobacterium]|uniref:3-deoxy-D-manno-octulosonic acid transferase n=1 Tax=Methylobacterium bullatum TaxID=570505 RepID=A0A679K729_9HYPH|nr:MULTISPECIES: 3-deoxy-D-manno-octulosonic acid transferase [unclassified Methylobacterium]KQO41176.1 3-deoxy-D-manno-octulosonic acid transferase [Methylobacterium sp. Leaf85]TXN27562.1 3-deoxy-D-manno-octulosonic acid transferase [Methylobacterium sp. WL19]CAA2143630.1 3-deoxy-D-manno-octulosonic acid transferase [Methylobacterium bullatum]